jgi:ABC-type uncharacterized transport system involved in gliding motility auxiliary subunit
MQKKSLHTILYSTAGVVVMLVILVAFNFIAGTARKRLDLTQDKAYTLSAGTKAILQHLDTPVTVRFYCTQSESATPETVYLKGYARKVEDLLAEYKQIAGSKLKIEKYDPQPDSDAEDSARLDGIEPKQLAGTEGFYLGMAVKCADAVQAIPFLEPNRERLLEYDLSRAIVRTEKPEKATIGLMSPLPVFGMPSNPMMQQMGQQGGSEPWALVAELKNDFNVKRVGMDVDKIDDDIKLLLVIAPKDISDKAQYAIDQFIMRGGKLIGFFDGQCLADNRQQQNQMMANMGGGGSSLDKLLKAWGIQFDTGKVVADMKYKMQLRGRSGEPQDAPAWLGLSSDAIDKDDVATSQIDNIWLPLCGAFTGTPVAGLKETVLLRSSKESQLVDAMLANFAGESMMQDFKRSGVNYNLAIRLTGKFKTAFPDGAPQDKKDEKPEGDKKPAEKKPGDSLKETKDDNAVVLFGDADMLYDPFTIRRIDSPFGAMQMAMNANLNLAQNLVEQMTGDSNLIAIRSRATLSRPFTRVKEMEVAANDRFQSEIKRLKDSAAEAQRKINEMQAQKKDKDQRFILSPEQRTELEKLRKEEGESRKRLKQVQKDLRKEVVSLQTRLKWINILAVPLAVAATGIVIAIVNRRKTSAK